MFIEREPPVTWGRPGGFCRAGENLQGISTAVATTIRPEELRDQVFMTLGTASGSSGGSGGEEYPRRASRVPGRG